MQDSPSDKLALITGWMRSSGLSFTELSAPEFSNTFAIGAAIRWSEKSYTLISIPLQGDIVAYITGGVIRDVRGNDKLRLLETCNDLTADYAMPAFYLHDSEEMGWGILCQTKVPVPIVEDVPQYFASLLQTVEGCMGNAREIVAERGIEGQPWQWTDEHLKSLLINGVF